MIPANTMMNVILQTVPAFQSHWQAHLDYWEGDEAGLCNDMQAFSDYVIEQMQLNGPLDLTVVFDLIEQLIVNGDEAVKNAATTCFLENLINSADAGMIDVHAFAPYVQGQSRKYCEAWESFSNG